MAQPDAFALLDEPRRPWPDLDRLKERFQERSAPVHPDRVHSASTAEREAATARYADLNAAYQRLKEPRDRLLHLLELERGTPPRDIQRIPPGTMDLFVEIGQACRDTDTHLQKAAGATSPMLKLQLMQAGLDWTQRLMALQAKVNAMHDTLAAELRGLNAAWDAAPAVGAPERATVLPLDRLEELYRAMSYVARWTGQLQERLVQLAV